MSTTKLSIHRVAVAVAATALVLGGVAAVSAPTVAAGAKDRDGDRMPDRWEARHGLNAAKANARKDSDGDDLLNLTEYWLDTDPQEVDSDGDGVDDRATDDHDAFGMVVDFDPATGDLRVQGWRLGRVLTFVVTSDTEIEADGEDGSVDDLVAGAVIDELEIDGDSGGLAEIELAESDEDEDDEDDDEDDD